MPFSSATTATNDNDGGISGGGKLLLKFDTAVEVRGGHVGRFDATIKADSKAWLTVNGVNATFSATASGDVEVRKYLSFCAILCAMLKKRFYGAKKICVFLPGRHVSSSPDRALRRLDPF